MKAVLVLSDGSVYYGKGFGAQAERVGELVFSTGMVGYQEALTDPSYAGQILISTYPLVGNYGVNKDDMESDRVHVQGYVARECCEKPNHRLSEKSLSDWLKEEEVPGIEGLDTRNIVRKIRSYGVMPAVIKTFSGSEVNLNELIAKAKELDYSSIDFVKKVTRQKFEEHGKENKGKHIVLIDYGLKLSILRMLLQKGVRVTIAPATATYEEIMKHEPDGILASNGPGDPKLLGYAASTMRKLCNKLPVMGICLGNQVLAHAFGGSTYKLKFGHRGLNHPVKDLKTGKVYITTQNHGFAVDPKSLPKEMEVTHINLNDGTVEGIRHKELPVYSVQYHPESNPGPLDSTYLFDDFIRMLK
ncbi:Anthranilate synthase component 2 [Candidatus Gugararchaeum adminiculabundum]|nr:Anthranilate synthase component 2 [Candidatus Gugararchaeum adminiculabundum]